MSISTSRRERSVLRALSITLAALRLLPRFWIRTRRNALTDQWSAARRRFTLPAYLRAALDTEGRFPQTWELWWAFKSAMGLSRAIYEYSYLYTCIDLIAASAHAMPTHFLAASDDIPTMAVFRGFVPIHDALNGRKNEFRHRVTLTGNLMAYQPDDPANHRRIWDLLQWCAEHTRSAWTMNDFVNEYTLSFADRADALSFLLAWNGSDQLQVTYLRIAEYGDVGVIAPLPSFHELAAALAEPAAPR